MIIENWLYLRSMRLGRIFILFLSFLIYNPLFSQYTTSDWKDRDQWMKVPDLMEMAEVVDGDRVADVGCHEGYLTFHLTKKVGPNGKVYAVDVLQSRLDRLNQRLIEKNVRNVTVVLGDGDDPKLPLGQLDAVFLIDTYHEIEDYERVLSLIKKSLKPGGRLLILEKLKDFAKGKDREAQAASHTLSAEFVKGELRQSGFEVVKENLDFGTWNHELGKQMWVLVGVPKNSGY